MGRKENGSQNHISGPREEEKRNCKHQTDFTGCLGLLSASGVWLSAAGYGGGGDGGGDAGCCGGNVGVVLNWLWW